MTIDTLPELYALDKKGKIRSFSAVVDETDGVFSVTTSTGLYGGSLITQGIKVTAGKQGRSVKAQAIFVAQSKWNEKRNEGYKSMQDLEDRARSLDLDFIADTVEHAFQDLKITYNTDTKWRPLPMLAEKWKDKKQGVKYPVYIQPKFDGVRCLALYDADLQEVVLVSREGKDYVVPHIQKQLEPFFLLNQNLVLDGELYLHGKHLQEISGEARRESDQEGWLEYHVYDYVDAKKDQARRIADLRIYHEIIANQYGATHIKHVDTYMAVNESEVIHFHNHFVVLGYEGAMVRDQSAPYFISFRDKCLLKVKEFEDAEFEILDCVIDTNKTIGESFVFQLKNDIDDQTFLAKPTGTHAMREKWYAEIEDLKGQKVKVRFPQRSKKGLPIQGHVRHTDSPALV